jgi:hypothetical protein
MTRELTGTALESAEIRAKLKAQYPGQKFSVRSHNYSMGSSIKISWVDGPLKADVEAIAKRYQDVSYDTASGEILSGGNQFVNCSGHLASALRPRSGLCHARRY